MTTDDEHDHDHDGADSEHDHGHAHQHGPKLEVDPARYEGIEGHVVKETSQAGRELLAVVPWDDFAKARDQRARKLARTVHLKGFRKGKAPVARIKQLYGDQLHEEAVEQLVQDTWQAAKDQAELRPVGAPTLQEIEVREGQPVRFAAGFEVLPTLTLQGLDAVSVDDQEVTVGDGDVDEQLQRLREQRASIVDSDKTEVTPGDLASVDMYRFAPGADPSSAEPDAVEEGVLIEVGSEANPPELDKALLGMGVGEMRAFTIPPRPTEEEGQEAGEPIPGKVLLKGVKERQLPELDDELARSLDAGFESVEELRADVRRRLVEARRSEAEAKQDGQVVEHLLKENPCEIPKSLVDHEAESRIRQALQGMARQGVDVENAKIDWAAEFERARQSAERALRIDYLLELAADQADVEISEDDVVQELEQEAERRGVDPRQLRGQLAKSNRMNDFKQSVRRRRTLDMLKAGATVTVQEPEAS